MHPITIEFIEGKLDGTHASFTGAIGPEYCYSYPDNGGRLEDIYHRDASNPRQYRMIGRRVLHRPGQTKTS